MARLAAVEVLSVGGLGYTGQEKGKEGVGKFPASALCLF
jgi:hypothetical protein